ncbi:MAG: lysoplasmalogenase [Bacteroidia bacterium]|nr:lysoplasmalogenase [Bacteroidia bacterium]
MVIQTRIKYWPYLLLVIPVVMAVLALNHFGFFFKSGSAGAGILILILLYFKKLKFQKDTWMIMLAFLFSIFGDWFLSNRHGDQGRFIAGIAMFFIAHVGYLAFALMNGKLNRRVTGIILSAFLLFYFGVLFPSFSEKILMAAVLVYLLISCFSLGAAVGIRAGRWIRWPYVLGIFLILFSDTIISFREFVGYRELDFLILPTYYAAHIIITFSLIKKAEQES